MQLGSTIFKAKILKVAFFNSEFLIVSVVNTAPESPTTLVTLMYSDTYFKSDNLFNSTIADYLCTAVHNGRFHEFHYDLIFT